MPRKGEDARPGPMVRGGAVCGGWSGKLFGQVICQRLTDQQRHGGHCNIISRSEHHSAGALYAHPRARALGESLDQSGFAMHEKCKVAARCHADAQAASSPGVWRKVGGLSPAQIFNQASDDGQFRSACKDQLAQGDQPRSRYSRTGVENCLYGRCWYGTDHHAASGRCNSVIRSSGAVSIGLFR